MFSVHVDGWNWGKCIWKLITILGVLGHVLKVFFFFFLIDKSNVRFGLGPQINLTTCMY